MGKNRIRTTINPGKVLAVDDAELLDLTRQGLVLPAKDAERLDKQAEAAAADAKTEGKDS